MKKLLSLVVVLSTTCAFARNVHVNGYYRSNGTYVHSYERTSPDSTRSNNYGRPNKNNFEFESIHPESRDYDGDGVVNVLDLDDDNDGIQDDSE